MLQKIHITSLHRENKEHISKKHLYLNILWKNNCTPFEIVIQPNNYFSVISWTILEFPSVVLLHSILWNCISITRTLFTFFLKSGPFLANIKYILLKQSVKLLSNTEQNSLKLKNGNWERHDVYRLLFKVGSMMEHTGTPDTCTKE